LKTQVTVGACTHGKLYNNVVRGKNVAAYVTALATTIDSGLNVSNFLPRYEGNAVLVLLMK
jgi:3-hydroxyisobutyrate dehydrogenase-like beta-hydroxyacid dehydrogenase